MTTLLIRADANPQIGTGHVMRSLALAQAWRDRGGKCLFVGGPGCFFPEQRLRDEGIGWRRIAATPGSTQDASETAWLAAETGGDWIVLDSYALGGEYQQQLKAAGARVLAIDDYGHAGHYCADLVLNQNFGAQAAWYGSREKHTRLLLGSQYVLLRREFWRWREWQRAIPPVARKLLVTMGGADVGNVTGNILDALADVSISDLEVVAVVGAVNPYRGELQRKVESTPHKLRLEAQVSDMPGLMASVDAAISAAGTTMWELMLMQLPFFALILADNQRPAAESLQRAGLIQVDEADFAPQRLATSVSCLLRDEGQRQAFLRCSHSLVDGRGVDRVLAAMEEC